MDCVRERLKIMLFYTCKADGFKYRMAKERKKFDKAPYYA